MNLTLTAVILLFGLLQSIIIIFLIVRNRNWRQLPNILLIALLLVVGFSLVPTFLGHAGLVAHYGFLRFLPLNLVIFVFPLLYLYIKSVFGNGHELRRKSSFHLVVPILFAVYHIFIWVGTLNISPDLKAEWASGFGYFEVQFAYKVVLLFFVFGYGISSFLEVRKEQAIPLTKQTHKYRQWVVYLLLFFLIGVLFELTAALLGTIYGYWKSSPLDNWLGFPLTMAVKIYNGVLLYGISLVGYLTYTNFKQKRSSVDKEGLQKQIRHVLTNMETEKPYLSQHFSLATFSRQLQMTPNALSNLLNSHLNISFNDFANRFRVDEVKERLKSDAYGNFTIESIAMDAGFKSKTTFYRAFYKFTSQTPKAYYDEISRKKKVS